MNIKSGIYRHYKGNEYEVIGMAKHSETLEPMVVYKALYGDYDIWVRPAAMWNEFVETDNGTVRRFTPISDSDNSNNRVVLIEDIADALEVATDTWDSFLNKETGGIVSIPNSDNDYADMDDEYEEILEEIDTTDKYIKLPDQHEIHEYGIMEDFAYDRPDKNQQNQLLYALKNRKPYRHFKDEINYMGIEEEYYNYRYAVLMKIAEELCEAHNVPYKYRK